MYYSTPVGHGMCLIKLPTIFKMPFICSRQTTIQIFQYKITHRILACNEWLNNIKIKICNTCSFCNDKDTISHFLLDCNSNKCFGKSWAK